MTAEFEYDLLICLLVSRDDSQVRFRNLFVFFFITVGIWKIKPIGLISRYIHIENERLSQTM